MVPLGLRPQRFQVTSLGETIGNVRFFGLVIAALWSFVYKHTPQRALGNDFPRGVIFDSPPLHGYIISLTLLKTLERREKMRYVDLEGALKSMISEPSIIRDGLKGFKMTVSFHYEEPIRTDSPWLDIDLIPAPQPVPPGNHTTIDGSQVLDGANDFWFTSLKRTSTSF